MTDPQHDVASATEFTCPKCGGHFYGRDVKGEQGKWTLLTTVRCDTPKCGWRGEWPKVSEE